MPKKCQPGVICVENATLLFIVILCTIAGYLAYSSSSSSGRGGGGTYSNQSQNQFHISQQQQQQNQLMYSQQQQQQSQTYYDMLMRPSSRDVLLDPHAPPVNMGYSYGVPPPTHPSVPPGRMAINVATSTGFMRTNYSQVGILTPSGGSSGNGTILALMGRQTHTSRQKWQYYTISDSNNSVKLPISRGGRSCTGDNGCDELSGGDTVYVEGYNQSFGVTMYDNDNMQYIPYL